jgi:ribonucleoside-diphosphate reductase alpha chain
MVGNPSSGLEPIFAYEQRRNYRVGDGYEERTAYNYAYRLYHSMYDAQPGSIALPSGFVKAHDVRPEEHVKMQAAVQRWIDASVSKTINCPTSFTLEDIATVYMSAYDYGCKACTTYRPSDVRGWVLQDAQVDASTITNTDTDRTEQQQSPFKRPEELPARVYKLSWPTMNNALYVTISNYNGRPYEMFLSTKSGKNQEWMTALSLMVTAIFRRGGNIEFVYNELKEVVSADEPGWMDGKWYKSIVEAIGEVIERHVKGQSTSAPEAAVSGDQVVYRSRDNGDYRPGEKCPACEKPFLTHQEGCKKCMSCGYTQC